MKLATIQQFDHLIILGYGLEGRSSHAFMKEKFPEKDITVIEKIAEPIQTNHSSFFTLDSSVPKNSLFIISPGINRTKLLAQIPTENQTSNTEIFFANLTENQRPKIIGISGSKGKSTTTKFTTELLQNIGYKAIAAGNYGLPLLDLHDQLDDLDFVVAELSSYQLEYLQYSPYYAIFLNFFNDHVERHGSLEAYFEAKANLWRGKEACAQYLFMPEGIRNKEQGIRDLKSELIECQSLSPNYFPADSIFRGQHFLENFGCGIKLIEFLNKEQGIRNKEKEENVAPPIPYSAFRIPLQETCQNLSPLPHRTELFAQHEGLKFYDDSISTNTETAKAAIRLFGQNLGAIILGGKSETGGTDDWSGVFELLKETSPQAYAWLPDSDTLDDIEQAIDETNFPKDKIIRGQAFNEILQKGIPNLEPRTSNLAVILSPGAKSFDRFPKFPIRGQAWKEAVERYFKIQNP